MSLNREDQQSLIRMVGLIGRHADALSDFEAQLVRDAVDRFRDRGERMSLTVNERHVLSDALSAMDRAKAAEAQADNDAAAGVRGAA